MQPSSRELQEDTDSWYLLGCLAAWWWACGWPEWRPEAGLFPLLCVTAALFERSRHACYVLLTGPQPGEEPGLVSLMKRKLKEDVSESKVIWLSQVAVDSEQYIRDRLYRMRFHSRV